MADRTAWHTEDWTTVANVETSVHVEDVTGWPTYELRAQQVSGSNREFVTARLRWYHQDPVANPGTEPSGVVDWDWSIPDQLYRTGPHHGKFVEVLFIAPTAGRTIRWSLAETTVLVPEPRAMQTTGLVLNASWTNLAAGGTGATVYALPTSGPLTLFLAAPSQNGEFRVNVGGAAIADIPVNATTEKVRIVTLEAPRGQLNGYAANKGSLAASFSMRAFTGKA